jgi:hypothetical protein
VLLRICKQYKQVYLDNKPITQFWKLVRREFGKATKNPYKTLDVVIKGLVKDRLQHLDSCSTGTEPEGGDLNQAIDAWIEVSKEKQAINNKKKKTADEIIASKEASEKARDNMKKARLHKVPVVPVPTSSTENDDDEPSDSEFLPENPSIQKPKGDQTPQGNQSSADDSSSPQPSTPQPATKRQKPNPPKSALYNKVRQDFIAPFIAELTPVLASLGKLDNKAVDERFIRTEERLSSIEAKLEAGQAELRSRDQQMLAMLKQIISQKEKEEGS